MSVPDRKVLVNCDVLFWFNTRGRCTCRKQLVSLPHLHTQQDWSKRRSLHSRFSHLLHPEFSLSTLFLSNPPTSRLPGLMRCFLLGIFWVLSSTWHLLTCLSLLGLFLLLASALHIPDLPTSLHLHCCYHTPPPWTAELVTATDCSPISVEIPTSSGGVTLGGGAFEGD